MDNNTQKQKEQSHAVLKGIYKALDGLNANLSTAGETEGTTVPVLERIAVALETIAERLNPIYMAEYTEPEETEPASEEEPPANDNPGEA